MFVRTTRQSTVPALPPPTLMIPKIATDGNVFQLLEDAPKSLSMVPLVLMVMLARLVIAALMVSALDCPLFAQPVPSNARSTCAMMVFVIHWT